MSSVNKPKNKRDVRQDFFPNLLNLYSEAVKKARKKDKCKKT